MPVSERSARIDRLRGLSILLVLLHHFDIAYKLPKAFGWSSTAADLVRALARNGNYGVTMFFVISGFLITSHAIWRWRTLDQIALPVFYALRAARIMPGLLLLLVTVAVIGAVGVPLFQSRMPGTFEPVSPLLVYGAALTFWMNVLVERLGWVNYPLGVLWSLSIEAAFYVAFPLLCRTLRQPALIAVFLIIVMVIGLVYRATHQGEEGAYLYAYPSALDGIAIGSLAALTLAHFPGLRAVPGWLRALIAVGMIVLYMSAPIANSNVAGVTLMAMGSAVLLLPRGGSDRPQIHWRWLEWFGRSSYELYLFHLVVLGLLRSFVSPLDIAPEIIVPLLLVFLVLSAVLANTITRFYAGPLDRRLRMRYAPKSARSGA